MGLKVYKEPCKNCLFSQDAIVSPGRRKEILDGIKKSQSYFECHKSTEAGENIMCRTFYDQLGFYSQIVRIAERLNAIDFVDMPDHDKYVSYNESRRKI